MKLVGIDIGATAVRCVEVDGVDREGYAKITKIGVVPLSSNAMEVGKVRNPLTVAQAVLRALKAGGMSGYGAVVGIANPQTALARADVPSAVKPEERLGVLRNGRREVSPTVPLGESALSISAIGNGMSHDGLPVTRIVAAVATHETVSAVLEVCNLSKVSPRALDHSAAALARALVRGTASNTDVHTMVDIGDMKTVVTTREGMDLRSMRTITVGGASITRAIERAAQINRKDAETMKRTMRLSSAARNAAPMDVPTGYGASDIEVEHEAPQYETLVEEALTASANALVDQIAQTVEADAGMYGMTHGITIVGGGAQMLGLRERLETRVGVPVIHGDPWATVVPSRHTERFLDARGQVDPVFLSSLTTAIGLALWQESNV
jgi:type IV pilus assembly protein PilM